MELNPNHPVTAGMRDHWHKIVALLMVKFNQRHLEISPSEIAKIADGSSGAIVVQVIDEKIVLDLVPLDEAKRLAKKEGGLPH